MISTAPHLTISVSFLGLPGIEDLVTNVSISGARVGSREKKLFFSVASIFTCITVVVVALAVGYECLVAEN